MTAREMMGNSKHHARFVPLGPYHHFKENLISPQDRVSKVERLVIDLLLKSPIPDSERESSIAFELKHHSNVTQFARLLSRKRGLPQDVCAVGAALHDIYVIKHGGYQDHAHRGFTIALEILNSIGGFSSVEIDEIGRIIYYHSDKHIWTDDPFQEFGKDVDVLDCFLYPGGFRYYLGYKPLSSFVHYLNRAKIVWQQLGIPDEPEFSLLENYGPHWFDTTITTEPSFPPNQWLAFVLSLTNLESCFPPAFCLVSNKNNQFTVYSNSQNWNSFIMSCLSSDFRLSRYFKNEEEIRIVKSVLNSMVTMPKTGVNNRSDDLYTLKESGDSIGFYTEDKLAHKLLSTLFHSRTPSALLFWPSVYMYEMLNGPAMTKRLNELGLTFTTQENDTC